MEIEHPLWWRQPDFGLKRPNLFEDDFEDKINDFYGDEYWKRWREKQKMEFMESCKGGE
ncbi:MAG: hypothetical protein GF370_00820 [Candidatus Nealsonbacteria bacterium]|nr:hypothetical protein [Candidatus Nealsonbacteria bacterium]